MFSDEVKLILERKRPEENNKSFALIYININSAFEHRIRDELLVEVTNRFHLFLQQGDFLIQIREEEFVIKLYNILDIQDIIQFSEKIISAFKLPFIVDDYKLYCTLNIGISIYPDDSEKIEELIKNSNEAMNYAKEQGINNYQLYTATMDIEGYQKFELAKDICKALKRNEFKIYYYLEANSQMNQIVGVEAFLCWNHPRWGIIPLEEFIALLKQHELINSVEEWLLRTMYSQAKLWQQTGLTPINISINLFQIQFLQQQIVQKVISVLCALGIQTVNKKTQIYQHNTFNNLVSAEELTELFIKGKYNPCVVKELYSLKNQIRHKDYCISLQYPLAADITILKIGEKYVKVGNTKIHITSIDDKGLRFYCPSKLPVKSDIILQVETEILNMDMKLQGSLIWKDQIRENIHTYGLQYKLNKLEKQCIANILNKLKIHLKYNLGKLNYRLEN